jgi:selenide,water dikinase
LDCSVKPLARFPDLLMISTTDFFFPLVDDPYYMGRIGCANVLSDLYSMGITNCDTILMLLAASNEMSETERMIVTRAIISGFNDCAKDAGSSVTGGQTVLNPWPIIGGVVTSIAHKNDVIDPKGGQLGDVLVLTKPIGTQVAGNVNQWLNINPTRWEQAQQYVTKRQAIEAYEYAMFSMSRLNRIAAELMKKHGAHGATDVTGFGLLGHARNLAQHQHAKNLVFRIHTLPVIANMDVVSTSMNVFKLLEGTSAETSGGLLIMMPSDKAEQYCREIEEREGQPAWIVGDIIEGQPTTLEEHAFIDKDNLKVISVMPPRDKITLNTKTEF